MSTGISNTDRQTDRQTHTYTHTYMQTHIHANTHTELEITVGNRPFSDYFQGFGQANSIC